MGQMPSSLPRAGMTATRTRHHAACPAQVTTSKSRDVLALMVNRRRGYTFTWSIPPFVAEVGFRHVVFAFEDLLNRTVSAMERTALELPVKISALKGWQKRWILRAR